jgi:hypothetical protein
VNDEERVGGGRLFLCAGGTYDSCIYSLFWGLILNCILL